MTGSGWQDRNRVNGKTKISHFTDLMVWQKSHRLFLDLFNDVELFPQKRGAMILTDQVLRSCGSISANLAEGFNRSTRKYLNCLDIALGETNETENWLYKVRDTGLLDRTVADVRIKQGQEIGRMLNGLIRSLEKGSDS